MDISRENMRPRFIFSRRLKEDVKIHSTYLTYQCSAAGFCWTHTQRGGRRSSVSATTQVDPLFSSLEEYTTAQLALSALAFFPPSRRNRFCPLWKAVKNSVLLLCPALAMSPLLKTTSDSKNIMKSRRAAGSESREKQEERTAVPSYWTVFHLCLAGHRASLVPRLFQSIFTPPLSAASELGGDGVVGTMRDTFESAMTSLIGFACFYDEPIGLEALLQHVCTQHAHSATGTSGSEEPSDILRSAANLDGGDHRLVRDLINDSERFEPLDKFMNPIGISLAGRSYRSLSVLLSWGATLHWEEALQQYCHANLSEAAMVNIFLHFLKKEFYHADLSINEPILQVISRATHSTGGGGKDRISDAARSVVEGETILHVSCRRGHAALTEVLLQCGGNAMLEDCHGYSAWQASVGCGHAKVTKLIGRNFHEKVNAWRGRQEQWSMNKSDDRDGRLEYVKSVIDEEIDDGDLNCPEWQVLNAVERIATETRIYLLRRHRMRRLIEFKCS